MATNEPPRPHRKTVKHFHSAGDLHELTFSCYQRRALLTNDDWRRRLSRAVDAAGNELAIDLVAFVFMPEHVHLLVYPKLPGVEIDFYLARLKQPFSKEIKKLLEQSGRPLLKQLIVQERPGKECFRFWQEGPGFDRNLTSPKAITASVDYIHNNPVKRECCRRATDWKWSSARYYLAEPPKQQDADLPHIAGLPAGALDEPLTP
ncbi:MAG: transposase [Planctomycetia bacterium]|nr:transposase [Planctomycetia bacterium]